jgi:predicted transcriptional regulator
MKINDLLKNKGRSIKTIGTNKSVLEAIQKLVRNNIGALPVCDAEGTMVGIVSERDLLKECSERATAIGHTKVEDIMTREVAIGTPEDDIDHVVKTMTQKGIRHLPVMEGVEVKGMISSRDVLGEQLEECNVQVGYLAALHETAKAINSVLKIDEVLSTIVRVTARVTGAKGCSIMLLDDEKKYLEHKATYGLSDQYLNKGVLKVDRVLDDKMKGKSIAIVDISDDTVIQYPAEAVKEGIASMINVSIRLRDELIGMIRIYSAGKQVFSSDTINLVSAIGELSAIAIDKAKMYDSLQRAHDVCLTELGYWQP